MSGIYLQVAELGANPSRSALQVTDGGYPHITVVYVGNADYDYDVAERGATILHDFIGMANGMPLVRLPKERAIVHSFFPREK